MFATGLCRRAKRPNTMLPSTKEVRVQKDITTMFLSPGVHTLSTIAAGLLLFWSASYTGTSDRRGALAGNR